MEMNKQQRGNKKTFSATIEQQNPNIYILSFQTRGSQTFLIYGIEAAGNVKTNLAQHKAW